MTEGWQSTGRQGECQSDARQESCHGHGGGTC